MPKQTKMKKTSFLISFIISAFVFSCSNRSTAKKTDDKEITATTTNEKLNTKTLRVLLYSKANDWVHEDAIAAGKEIFPKLAKEKGWDMVVSDDSRLYHLDSLRQFDVVIWNNVTGKSLNAAQQNAFRTFLENGGGFVGIHGAGDSTQEWDWYEQKVIRASFSHHPMEPQFQTGILTREGSHDFHQFNHLPKQWKWEEEWYVFYESPRQKGSTILYTLDETGMVMKGEHEGKWKDKNWGMGKDHPIVWYHSLKKGKAIYTALGHKGIYYNEPHFQQLIVEAIAWAGNFNQQTQP